MNSEPLITEAHPSNNASARANSSGFSHWKWSTLSSSTIFFFRSHGIVDSTENFLCRGATHCAAFFDGELSAKNKGIANQGIIAMLQSTPTANFVGK